ncbi:MAG: Xaa-Pro peptidase family protein, partial [Rhizomicrobium sp.]
MSIGGSTPEKELAALVAPTLVPAITAAEREGRIEKARSLIRAAGADALLIGRGASLDYFAGIAGGASERLMALLVPVSGKPVLIGPYFEAGSMQAALEIEADLRLWQEEESPSALVGAAMRDMGYSKLAIDPDMAISMVLALGRATSLVILDGAPVVFGCRMHKSETEIAILQQAMNMTLTVQKAVARIIAEGMAADDIVQFIDAAHRKLGSAGSSFCIVQFGRGTAFPHGLPGVQRVKENDLVLVDTGCWLHGYSSDMTRTY